MADYEICCTKCLNNLQFPDSMLGDQIQCPECGNTIGLLSPPAILAPSEPVYEDIQVDEEQPLIAEPEPTIPESPNMPEEESAVDQTLPERMKANKRTIGKACAICNVAVELGDDLYNCQECLSTMHARCYEESHACGNPDCSNYTFAVVPKAPAPKSKLQLKKNTAPEAGLASTNPTMPCKFCGEEIAAIAKKCRFCGEFQNDIDRKLQKQKGSTGGLDEELSWGEIVLAIFCSGIACILAIVYICQGKKKGTKLLIISIVVQVILGALRAIIEHK